MPPCNIQLLRHVLLADYQESTNHFDGHTKFKHDPIKEIEHLLFGYKKRLGKRGIARKNCPFYFVQFKY